MGSSLILFNFFAIVFLEFSLFHQWRKELRREEDQGFSFLIFTIHDRDDRFFIDTLQFFFNCQKLVGEDILHYLSQKSENRI